MSHKHDAFNEKLTREYTFTCKTLEIENGTIWSHGNPLTCLNCPREPLCKDPATLLRHTGKATPTIVLCWKTKEKNARSEILFDNGQRSPK